MARLEEHFSDEILNEILNKVAAGQSIIKVLQSDKDRFPQWDKFRQLKRENEQLNVKYIKALQDRATALENQIEEYKELLINKAIDPATANVLIQTNKWAAGKFYPKMFGDNIKLSIQDTDEQIKGININIIKNNGE